MIHGRGARFQHLPRNTRPKSIRTASLATLNHGAASRLGTLRRVRVAIFQFDVRVGDVDHNVATVESAVRDAARECAALVVLPEMWPTSFPDAESDLASALDATERALERMRALTVELDIAVCGSAFGRTNGLPTNRWHLLARGELCAAYDKVHLFTPTAEDASFSAGVAPPEVAACAGGRVGGIVCYDLRFPEVARQLFHDEANVIAVSAQWPDARTTHFEALCIGRAVESQCFVVACNRTGRAHVGRRRMDLAFPGGSLIVDPNGRVLARAGGEPELLVADIDLDLARTVRVRIPVARDEQLDVYARWRAGDR